MQTMIWNRLSETSVWRKECISILALFLIGALGLLNQASGQVVIKERVEVQPFNQLAVPGVSIAQDGIMEMTYYQAIRWETAFPADMVLQVLHKPVGGSQFTVVAQDTIITHLLSPTTSNLCGSITVPLTRYHHWGNGVDVISIGSVAVGDSLKFHWVTDSGTHGDQEGEGGVLGLPPSGVTGWDSYYGIVNGITVPDCNQEDYEQLEFLLRTVPNTTPSFTVTAVQNTIVRDTISVLSPFIELNVLASDRLEQGFDPDFSVDLSLSDPTLGHFELTEIDESNNEIVIDSGVSLSQVPYDALDPGFRFSATETRFAYFIPNDTTTAGKTRTALSQLANEEDYATIQINAVRSDDANITGTGNLVVDMRTFQVRLNSLNAPLVDGLYSPTDTVSVADTVLVEALANNRMSLQVEDQNNQVSLLLPQFVDGRFVLQSKSSLEDEWTEVAASDSTITVNYHSLDPGYEGFLRTQGESIDYTQLLFVPGSILTPERFEILDMVATDPARYSHLGESFFVVDRYKLKMFLPTGREYWPTIHNGAAHPNFFQIPNLNIDNKVDNIMVTFLDNGQVDTQQDIRIIEDFISLSGGHTHDSTYAGSPFANIMRPTLPINSPARRVINNVTTTDTVSVRGVLTSTTNQDGKIFLQYITPTVGGEIILRTQAIVGSDSLTALSDTLTIRVPDLVLMQDGTNFDLVGGTSAHTGPRDDGSYPNHREPDDNHFAIQSVADSLESIADAWTALIDSLALEPDDQSPVDFNDMSLPNGGLFDERGNWDVSHQYHRVGRDVDIRTTRWLPSTHPTYPSSREGIYLRPVTTGRDTVYVNLRFEALVRRKGANDIGIHGSPSSVGGVQTNGSEHYHVYFYND